MCAVCAVSAGLQRPLNTRDPVSLAGRDTNYRNTPISWKGPKHEKCIVDKVMVTSECVCWLHFVYTSYTLDCSFGAGRGDTNRNAGAGTCVSTDSDAHS